MLLDASSVMHHITIYIVKLAAVSKHATRRLYSAYACGGGR